ncbi:MAG TPA: AlpA family phage regulatory protein [Acidobacteriaceae bacterium]|jgi:predicted DNA-binding transcriptional regulator AlpA
MTDAAEDQMNLQQVCRFFGGKETPVDRSTIYRWVKAGRIPSPTRVGPKMSRWSRAECNEALQAMKDASK